MRFVVSLFLLLGFLLAIGTLGAPRREDPVVITHEILHFSPDGESAFVWGRRNGVRDGFCIWNLKEATNQLSNLFDILGEFGSRPVASAISPDGKWVAMSTAKDVIRVREVAGEGVGRALEMPKGFGGISYLAFSPDGKTLLANGEQGTRSFNLATGRPREWQDPLSGPVAFSPDGRLVATRTAQVSVYEVATGQLVRRLPHDGTGGDWFNATGRALLTWAGQGQPTVLVEVAGGREIWRLDQPENHLAPLGLGTDGTTVLLQTRMKTEFPPQRGLLELDLLTRREIRRCPWQEDVPADVVASPDGKRGLSGGKEVVFWNLETGREIRTFSGAFWEPVGGPTTNGRYFPMSFSPNGSRVVTVHGDILIVSDTAGKAGEAVMTCQPRPGARFADTGADRTSNIERRLDSHVVDWKRGRAYARFGDGEIVTWNLSDGEIVQKFRPDALCRFAGLSPDGGTFYTMEQHRENERSRYVKTGRSVQTGKRVGSATPSDWVIVLRNGQWVDYSNGELTLHDADDRLVWRVKQAEFPRHVSVLSDSRGERLAVVGRQITFYDLTTGEALATREFPRVKPGEEKPVTLSPDARLAVGALANGRVWLWDFERGTAQELVPRGWTWPLTNAAFSADGKRVLGAMHGGKLCLWDTTTGSELAHWKPVELQKPLLFEGNKDSSQSDNKDK